MIAAGIDDGVAWPGVTFALEHRDLVESILGPVEVVDLHGVEPSDAFGIPAGLPPGTAVALKNGWMRHASTGEWNLNCVAAWGDHVLAVLTRYPAGRPQSYGADVCRDVTAAVVGRVGS